MPVIKNGKQLLTYSDYLHFPEDGQRHEIILGEHYVTPSPSTSHQTILSGLHHQLFTQIVTPKLGILFPAPTDLLFSDTDIVQPDLIVVLERNKKIVTEKNIQGVPDLTIEITSPSTKNQDLKDKKKLYQRYGVPEYWIVHGEERGVEKFILEGKQYNSSGLLHDHVAFDGIAGVVVDLQVVWESIS